MKIAILLATYNSGNRLCIQLNSILNQTYTKWNLYIQDDGSTDNTKSIIKDYVKKDDRIKFLENDKKEGAKGNFISLLKKIEADYYMFCDQDDLWLPNKIEISLSTIYEEELKFPQKAICYHTDLAVCDKDYNIIFHSLWKQSKIKPKILEKFNYLQIFNCVTGCTMIFNKRAKEVSLPFNSKAPMHDWWIAYCVLKNNGILKHINKSTMLYCQHGTNEVGAINMNSRFILNKIKNIQYVYRKNKEHYLFLKELGTMSLSQFIINKIRYEFIRIL